MSALAPMRMLNRPKPTVVVERRTDGVLILSAGRELPEDRPLMIDWLQRAAARRPHVTFLAERRGADRTVCAGLPRGGARTGRGQFERAAAVDDRCPVSVKRHTRLRGCVVRGERPML